MPRYFTPGEANALLPSVRPLVERMVEHRRELAAAMAAEERLTAVVRGNGGGLHPRSLAAVRTQLEKASAGIARCVSDIAALGGVVKDVDRGLVDFPARREGTDVLLCWQLGEDEIRYWHPADEGFAGRRELPL